ncbi:MAG: BlaI/MecI/CopY family transcriptional regulator [Bacteroidia bacterium]|nr:BlaI/MecI/CopY family transcriptional regulator [Bacteroidia bacterium]
MQKLTKAEEDLMHLLWDLDQAFLKDIMEALPEPKPSQSTISTVLRILEEKGFASHESFGRTHRYYALVSKEAYASKYFKHFLGNYFDGSFQKMLSFFSKQGDLDLKDIDALLNAESDDPSLTDEP